MKLSKNSTAVLQTTLAAVVLLTLHLLGNSLMPGWTTWALSVPALIIIVITAAARLHDITAIGKRWFVRRLGMILAASGAASLLIAPLLGYSNAFPTWRSVCMEWGFALAWLTTPNMPPWWKYISGEWKLNRGQQA